MIRLMTALPLLALAACAGPVSQPGTELVARSAVWQAALNGGDIDALAALYTEDARILPPNAEMGTGQGAARDAFGEMIDGGLKVELTTLEAMAAADIGYQVGSYIIQVDGAPVDRGKFIEVWRLVDGQWRIANDIWNSDMPTATIVQQVEATLQVVDP